MRDVDPLPPTRIAPRWSSRERDHVTYRVLRAWARAAVSVFYRRTEVTGVERLPSDAPVVLASNHANALADIAVVVAKAPRFPHFLASATWWEVRWARLLFRLGGVVPVHRSRDGDTARNVATFVACNDALAARAHICIFVEGEMNEGPSLLPVKTGAARIALGAACEGGIDDVVIVPLGLVYEDRGRFRSRAEMCVGEPIAMSDWVDRYRSGPEEAVRAVTRVLEGRLAGVTVNHPTPEEALLVDRAAGIALATAGGDVSLSVRNALRRALGRALETAGGEHSDAYVDLRDAVDAHLRVLAALGFDDREIEHDFASDPRAAIARLRRELLALAAPAAFGAIVNAPTVLGVATVATRARDGGWHATVKGVGGTFLAPLVWWGEYALLSRRLGRRAALVLTATGALAGCSALAFHDRWARLRPLRRHARRLALRRDDVERAAFTQAQVRAVVEKLAVASFPA